MQIGLNETESVYLMYYKRIIRPFLYEECTSVHLVLGLGRKKKCDEARSLCSSDQWKFKVKAQFKPESWVQIMQQCRIRIKDESVIW